ncbi:breast carcinoma-amplified sequence 1 isoform X2 [Genypterus blacodes]|uniref:breast carcinoma-amplified sequence 1 isoform X2 n=1 Tax=Genypterus blacodes TaxID=154954 RepID=UPI003F75D906
MGNENSKGNESTKNGTIGQKNEKSAANGHSIQITSNGVAPDVTAEATIQQNGEPPSIPAKEFTVEQDCQDNDVVIVSVVADITHRKDEIKETENALEVLGNMLETEAETPANEDPVAVSPPAADPQPDTTNIKQESEPLTEPESLTVTLGPTEGKVPDTEEGKSEVAVSQKESKAEEPSVMNFFKSLVTPTKTPKKDTATPDATKDQSQKESQAAAATTVAQVSDPPAASKGMSYPPPPPPEPPKMEIKGDPGAKPVKPTPKEEPKSAAKAPESSKGKFRFFRSKKSPEAPQPVVEVQETAAEVPAPNVEGQSEINVAPQETAAEVPQPIVEVQSEINVTPQETAEEVPQPIVEVQTVEDVPQPVVEPEVDASKAGTLEASAKPEPLPPAQEEKKTPSKPSFLGRFKPKAAEPKKASPGPPAPAEAAQTPKAKEEPKAAAKTAEAGADNKQASGAPQSGADSPNAPKKLEKRNSFQVFFKTLSQKRPSTDAGVQTEPLTTPPAEKGK